ncbi:hypothetical protein DFP72DRAFT_839478 [Ephemerocybe angulata]|uniref:Uncharacterized protein n=1 Tax=Ephemerocybe angulata TaxID=980116 RepID=A0A8H6IJL1_9AGAR|nr:hypothetical protein DFP72DRAFT_839478 [Tulosesus angulatus]
MIVLEADIPNSDITPRAVITLGAFLEESGCLHCVPPKQNHGNLLAPLSYTSCPGGAVHNFLLFTSTLELWDRCICPPDQRPPRYRNSLSTRFNPPRVWASSNSGLEGLFKFLRSLDAGRRHGTGMYEVEAGFTPLALPVLSEKTQGRKSGSLVHPSTSVRRISISIIQTILQMAASTSIPDPSAAVSPFTLCAIGEARRLRLVCTSWRAVYDSTPSLWTAVVVFHDSGTAQDSLRTQIDKSRKTSLLLSLYVLRRSAAPRAMESKDGEREMVNRILDQLVREKRRIGSLVVDTYWSSSLPDPATILAVPAFKDVSRLELNSTFDDVPAPSDPLAAARSITGVNGYGASLPPFSNLSTLSLDGKSVVGLLTSLESSSCLYRRLSMLESFTITHISSSTIGFTVPMMEHLLFLIDSLGHLKRLAFVDFDIEEGTIFPAMYPPLFPTFIGTLEIKRTKWSTIAPVFAYLSPSKVTLEQCYFNLPSHTLGSLPTTVTHLTLSHLSEYAAHPLGEVLSNWTTGVELTIDSSEFLSNEFLLLFRAVSNGKERPILESLRHLRVVDCSNCQLTTSGLLDFLEARALGRVSRLEALEVIGSSPKLLDLGEGYRAYNLAGNAAWE